MVGGPSRVSFKKLNTLTAVVGNVNQNYNFSNNEILNPQFVNGDSIQSLN